MFRQAVQTLRGGAGDPGDVNPYDDEDVYLRGSQAQEPDTQSDQDGQSNEQDSNSQLQATVDGLVQRFDNMQGRMAEKDRYIGQLEGETRTLRAALPMAAAGGEPNQTPDPVLDDVTAGLFAEKYKEDPAAALVALSEHLDQRSQTRMAAENQQRDQAAHVASQLQGIERNILRQVDLAISNYGPAANAVVNDFLDLVRRGNASPHEFGQTWLGRELAADKPLAETTGGVHRLIELEVIRRNQGNTPTETAEEVIVPRTSQSTGISRPTAPSRQIATPSDGSDEVPIEDRIGNAIVDSARGDDAELRNIFHG